MKRKQITATVMGALMLFGVFFGTKVTTEAKKLAIDTTIETTRECGTELYDAIQAKNEMTISVKASDGSSTAKLLDADYTTAQSYKSGTVLTVTSDSPMYATYIIWDSIVPTWQLNIDGETYTYGTNGFLHEYIVLPKATTSFEIVIPSGSDMGKLDGIVSDGMRVSDIYALPDEKIPSWVQVWQPVLEDADVMIVSTHSDDEDIFFGGIVPTYGAERGLKVQVVYLVHHWVYSSNSKIREHEKLNGLWAAGDVYYPIIGNFRDAYSESLSGATSSIKLEDATQFLAECLRRCKPLVFVTHDENGEYGHGQHMLSSAASVKAVQLASDSTYDTESAKKYGTWNTPKFYMHLYGQNKIVMPMREPLSAFNGLTAITVARQAYLCHISQQYTWFTVDDYGPYNNAAFGLVRSLVGADEKRDDMMENLTADNEETVRMMASYPTDSAENVEYIYFPEDLSKIAENPWGSFVLKNDIDMTGYTWKPVDFYGTIDGEGHGIYNLTVSGVSLETAMNYGGDNAKCNSPVPGLFGVTKGVACNTSDAFDTAEIKDVVVFGLRADYDGDGVYEVNEEAVTPKEHTYADVTVVTDSTVDEEGFGSYVCADCGETVYVKVPKKEPEPEPSAEPVKTVEDVLSEIAAEPTPEPEEWDSKDYATCILTTIATLAITVGVCIWYFKLTGNSNKKRKKKK